MMLGHVTGKERRKHDEGEEERKKRIDSNGVLMQVVLSIISIVFAFLVGGIIIATMGETRLSVFRADQGRCGNIGGADCVLNQDCAVNPDRSRRGGSSRRAACLISARGQLLWWAFAAGYVGFTFHLPAPSSHSALSGGRCACRHVLGVYCGFLKYTRNVHVVVATIMLNYIATSWSSISSADRLRNRGLPLTRRRQLPGRQKCARRFCRGRCL